MITNTYFNKQKHPENFVLKTAHGLLNALIFRTNFEAQHAQT